MFQFVRPIQCFWCFNFFVLFCLWHFKGQGQWVIKYYINIYERKRRWFVIQNLNWARGGKCKDDPSHLDRNLNFASHTHKHTHTQMHTQFSLLTSQLGAQLTLCLKHVSSVNDLEGKTMDGTCNIQISSPSPWTSHHWTPWLRNRVAGHVSKKREAWCGTGGAEKSSEVSWIYD